MIRTSHKKVDKQPTANPHHHVPTHHEPKPKKPKANQPPTIKSKTSGTPSTGSPTISGPHNVGSGVDPKPDAVPTASTRTGYLKSSSRADVFSFWLTEVQASFSIGGSFGQSQKTRTFYPRNLGAAVLTLTGVSPSSAYYQGLAEYVRSNYVTLMQDGVGNGLITLALEKDNTPSRRLMKGPRQAYNLDGYITSITRGARRFEYYPTFQFEFIISRSLANSSNGLFDSNVVSLHKMQSFTQLIEHSNLPFVQNPSKDSNNTSTQKPSADSLAATATKDITDVLNNAYGVNFL